MARLTITPLGNGRYRVTSGTRDHLAWMTGLPGQRWIFFDGRVFLIGGSDGSDIAQNPGLPDDMALASPMPATVTAVNVAPGQTVTAGDVLVMLEAMKMELPIAAPRDARVRSVACTVGDLVQPGVPLMELE